jgi:hypothetical protein
MPLLIGASLVLAAGLLATCLRPDRDRNCFSGCGRAISRLSDPDAVILTYQ